MDIMTFIKNSSELTYQLGLYQNKYLVIKDKQSSEWEFFSHTKHDCIVKAPKSKFIVEHPEILYQNPDESPDNNQITFFSEGNWLLPVSYGEYTDIINCWKKASYPPLHNDEFQGVCCVPGQKCFPIVKKRAEIKRKKKSYWETFTSNLAPESFSKEYLETCENHIYLIVYRNSYLYVQKQNFLPYRNHASKSIRENNYEEHAQFLQFFCKKTGLDEKSANELLLEFGKKTKKNIYNGFYLNQETNELYPLEIKYQKNEITNRQIAVSTGPCSFNHSVLNSLKPTIKDPWNQKDHLIRIIIFGGSIFHIEKVLLTSMDTETINNSIYEERIQTPVYKICGKKYQTQDLTVLNQYKKMLNLIKSTKNLTSEEQIFFNLAASRFIQFDYEKIAEYYGSSDEHMKKLMEKIGLVIVDHGASLEKGYLKMTEDLENLALQCTEIEK